MSGFSSAWLALREDADARARDPSLARTLGAHLQHRREIRVLDLGCGTGSSLRWLAPRLAVPQRWTLVDHDPALLDAARETLVRWSEARGRPARVHVASLALGRGVGAMLRQCDLARALPALDETDLVTASALLDLVSREWVGALAAACTRAQPALLLSLIYDGRTACTPVHPHDARIRDRVNRHQLGDKGFGPALGPGAAAAATTMLRRAGYRVIQARSDWVLDRRDGTLIAPLLSGWAAAARELLPTGDTDWVRRWLDMRLARTDRVRVGHVDLLALPPA